VTTVVLIPKLNKCFYFQVAPAECLRNAYKIVLFWWK